MLATLGTDHHRFDRFVGWIDSWAASHHDVDVLVQHGASAPPLVAKAVQYLPYERLAAAMTTTDAVVCHGGPATIIEARRLGHMPIVVPRVRKHHEHVDDHQVHFARRMESMGELVMVQSQDDLGNALSAALSSAREHPRSTRDLLSPPAEAALRVSQVVNRLVG